MAVMVNVVSSATAVPTVMQRGMRRLFSGTEYTGNSNTGSGTEERQSFSYVLMNMINFVMGKKEKWRKGVREREIERERGGGGGGEGGERGRLYCTVVICDDDDGLARYNPHLHIGSDDSYISRELFRRLTDTIINYHNRDLQ